MVANYDYRERGRDYLAHMHPGRGTKKYNTSLVQRVLEHLRNPQRQLSVIHVTGTNGKGSVSATVGAVLAQTGAKVGLTISPHLERLEERVVVDGVPIDTSKFEEAFGVIAECEDALGFELSMHEAMTTCALYIFERERVDWTVVEVGMGGERDSTNVFESPKVVVLTSVSLDHTKTLGDSIQAIARDKLGIVKRGTTLVVGRIPEEIYPLVVQIAREREAECLIFNRDFEANAVGDGNFEFVFRGKPVASFRPSLRGAHQISNMAVAAAVTASLGIAPACIKHGIERVFWPARLESARAHGREIWFDCAHNSDGISKLVGFVQTERLAPVDIVFGVLEDKSWKDMCDQLQPIVRDWKLLQPESPRAISSDGVAEYLSGNGVSNVEVIPSAEDLLPHLRRGDDRPVLVTGSMYMVGKVRSKVITKQRPLWIVPNSGVCRADDSEAHGQSNRA